MKGTVVLHTEFYDPVVLKEGQSIYFDSSMGHAYLVAEGCDQVEMLTVMTSSEGDLDQSIIHAAHTQLRCLST
ncbi:hypothetical protein HMPREF9710_01990 [Massilia timonae CCUG 45783]|uniref:Cupin 2 conserved barrel domain-containing protein n=1 Tax=Massilia timonae CCUG 45783 TaxID=883126 RepID=K9DHH7_9BURK|nr:hypothetical protein HMPREF9710_01990 [Massilia timonae CCUG 45783]